MYIQPLYIYTITTNIYTNYNTYIYTITLTIYSKLHSWLVDIYFAGTNFEKSATQILKIQILNLLYAITTELTGRHFRKSACYLIYYGVATISRMLKNIGLFCKRDLQKRPIFCKETYIFKHPTNRSHPIHNMTRELTCQNLYRKCEGRLPCPLFEILKSQLSDVFV